MSWSSLVSLLALVTLAVPSPYAQSQRRKDPLPESFTANAQFTGPAGGAAATLKIRVERYTPDAEREAVLQALKQGGYPGFVEAVRKAPAVGSVAVGGHTFDIRWARESPIANGRSIVVVTDKPMFFVGAGSPSAKPREGYEVGVISFQIDDSGMGYGGKMAAAAKVKGGEGGGVEISEYADKLLELRSVTRDLK